MSKVWLLLWFGLLACPNVDKRGPRQPAEEETPSPQDTPWARNSPQPPAPPRSIRQPRSPASSKTPLVQETTMPVTTEEDNDPRRDEHIDTAVAPSLWVYFSQDNSRGYRALLLFGHWENVSDVQVEYVAPTLQGFDDKRYQDMQDDEKQLFSQQKLQVQVSFMFDNKKYCGSASITEDNIVATGSKVTKDKHLKVESEAC